MGMKVIDLHPPPACLKCYRLKFSLFTKNFIICTNKALHHTISNSYSFTAIKMMYLSLCLRSSSTSLLYSYGNWRRFMWRTFAVLIIMANASDIGNSTLNDTWPELFIRLKNTSKSVYWVPVVVFINILWFHL